MQIDLTALTEEQLTALTLIAPEAVASERGRRSAYASITDFLTDLAQAGLDLATVMAQVKGTQASQGVKGTNILEVIERGLGYARLNGLTFNEPMVKAIVIQKFPRKGPVSLDVAAAGPGEVTTSA